MANAKADALKDKLAKKNTEPKPEPKAVGERKTVQRTINGKIVKLTPTENFIDRSAYRLLMVKAQLDQMGKQIGPNYESTDQMVDAIEDQLLGMIAEALDKLRNPVKHKATKRTNPFVKILQTC